MTVTSPIQKIMRVADTVRRFYHFLLWREEFLFDVVGNFELKKLLQTAMHCENRLFLTLESLTFNLFFLDSVQHTNKKACSDIIGTCE